LLVDDEPFLTSLLRLNLEDTGNYEVREVNNSLQALATIEDFMPDVILLDVMMPDMDGADVIYRLKNDQRLKHILVVFHTATVRRTEMMAHGTLISGYPFIAKPASTATIIETIEAQLAPGAAAGE
jgi:CheY-like chemotaxis protein